MVLKTPWILLLIPVALLFVFWVRRKQGRSGLRFPSVDLVSSLHRTWKTDLSKLPFYLRVIVLVLMILALAGPRSILEETQHKTEGIDIVLAIDASGSMQAEDFKMKGKRYNRLAVVKDVVHDFIDRRPHDRIGLVAFAGKAYTVSPLTTDHSWLKTNLDRIDFNVIQDGTAVGSALASSLARLKKSQAKSKMIILLTDGINNAGKIAPLEAAEAARALKVKVYTIGAGTKGFVPFPVTDVWGRRYYQEVRIDIDEATLQEIAAITGAKYFRATDTESLRQIYQEIDAMEKTEIEEFGYREYRELFVVVLALGLILLFIEMILSNTLLLRLP
jgi:Ca-activated chloride channel family protein